MPQLVKHAEIVAVSTSTGVSARAAASRFGAGIATTDAELLLDHADVDAVVIATRHDSHAGYAAAALTNGKHVFVEKPLALSDTELAQVEAAARDSEGVLMVGYNRRFAPLAQRMRQALADRGPFVISYRVNAGPRGRRLPFRRSRDLAHGRRDPVR